MKHFCFGCEPLSLLVIVILLSEGSLAIGADPLVTIQQASAGVQVHLAGSDPDRWLPASVVTNLDAGDRLGLSSWTEYRSDGQVRELASQYGNIGAIGDPLIISSAWASHTPG